MTDRIPSVPDGLEDEGLPQGDTLASKEATGDAQEGYAMPRDHSTAVEDFGTTPEEESAGESLDGRLARELPDSTADGEPDSTPDSDEPFVAGTPGYDVGRLVETDALAAQSDGLDEGGFSAEESAMHLDQQP